jgi:hypothetical protein
MQREIHRGRRSVGAAAVLLLAIHGLGASPPVLAAGGVDDGMTGISTLPDCPQPWQPIRTGAAATRQSTWHAQLDGRGWLEGYQLGLGGRPGHTWRVGPSAFRQPSEGYSLIVGERGGTATQLYRLDPSAACVISRSSIPALVFGLLSDSRDESLIYSAVEPGSRRELGTWRTVWHPWRGPQLLALPPTGAWATAWPRRVSLSLDAHHQPQTEWCVATACLAQHMAARPDSGVTVTETTISTAMPIVSSRPVPPADGASWSQNASLSYRWHTTDTPPSWMRGAINDAAQDDSASRRSMAPTFHFDSGASDTVRYTADFPSGGCQEAIACASRSVPDWWTIRLRVQGYDFRWGNLRWCQAGSGDGCFDVERTAVHEFGHVAGLDHPEAGGFDLKPLDTVMHAIIPARPLAGNGMHAYGPCDVATLQERYDLLSYSTPVSTCNSVDTRLTLGATSSVISLRDMVTFVATLTIVDRDSYGRLGGDPLNGRSVQLRRRPAGSDAAWATFWMSQAIGGGVYIVILQPSITYEYQAVLRSPDDEGLNGSTSNTLTVRVIDTCSTAPCPNGETHPHD